MSESTSTKSSKQSNEATSGGAPHSIEVYRSALAQYISDKGLKSSKQRDIVSDVFFRHMSHASVETLLAKAREVDPKIGQATVYRTVKLLSDAGLAETRRFFDGQTLYEPKEQDGEHHDHLICTQCGLIIEFVNEKIEALQEKVAKEYGFKLTDHRMELFGECTDAKACNRRSKEKSESLS